MNDNPYESPLPGATANDQQVPPKAAIDAHSLRSHSVTIGLFLLTAAGLAVSTAVPSVIFALGLSNVYAWKNPALLFTYAIPHGGPFHWLVNAIPLVVSGWLIEPHIGGKRVLTMAGIACIFFAMLHLLF